MKTLDQTSVRCGNEHSMPVLSVRYLGILLGCEMSFKKNITKTVASCFGMLRQIRSIRRSVSPSPLLVFFLVHSRLDYCVSAVVGVPSSQLSRLQAVLNAAARLIFGYHKYSSISPFLQHLQWLTVHDRINLCLSSIAHSCLIGKADSYLSDKIRLVS